MSALEFPELGTWRRRWYFRIALSRLLDITRTSSDASLRAAWDELDEDQQRGVFEEFSIMLMTAAIDDQT